MMVTDTDIVGNAAAHVRELLGARLSPKYSYHSIEHTEETVEGCRRLAEASHIGTLDLDTLLLAAWFHDTGYIDGHENHEERSVAIATAFLTGQGYPADRIAVVAEMIRTTHYPQSPSNLLEMLLCDADMMHLGSKRYVDKEVLLRREEFEARGKSYTEAEWIKSNIEFLGNHRYCTQRARELFDAQRLKNITKLQKRLNRTLYTASEPAHAAPAERSQKQPKTKKMKVIPPEPPPSNGVASAEIVHLDPTDVNGSTLQAQTENESKKSGSKSEREKGKTERGIETMFRTTAKNHLDLSAMADNKANILITINSLVVSIVITLLMRHIEDSPSLLIPTIILMIVCMTTIIFGVIATRPKISSGVFTPEDIRQKKVNLLFFGNFYSMSLQEYESGMQAMMNDRDYLYGSMIADIYYLGKVLERKYRYIRIGYTIFMYGFAVSIIAFGVAFILMS